MGRSFGFATSSGLLLTTFVRWFSVGGAWPALLADGCGQDPDWVQALVESMADGESWAGPLGSSDRGVV